MLKGGSLCSTSVELEQCFISIHCCTKKKQWNILKYFHEYKRKLKHSVLLYCVCQVHKLYFCSGGVVLFFVRMLAFKLYWGGVWWTPLMHSTEHTGPQTSCHSGKSSLFCVIRTQLINLLPYDPPDIHSFWRFLSALHEIIALH